MRKSILSVLLVAALLAAGANAARATDDAHDWVTTLRVKLDLLTHLGVDALHIDVDTTGGQVVLAGTVEKRESKELAGELTRNVDGVRTVENDLRLESAQRDPSKLEAAAKEAKAELADVALETRVRLELVNQLGSDGLRIGTEAADGVVTLEFGKDVTGARRTQAVTAVQTVQGVNRVMSIDKQS